MDPINRNDPYEAVNPVELNAITRNDSYGTLHTGSTNRPQDPYYIFRVAGVVAGMVVVLAGVYFAGASFVIVRDILEEPQRLNAYLDEWYIPPREEIPAPEDAKNASASAQTGTPAEAPASATPPASATSTPAASSGPVAEAAAPVASNNDASAMSSPVAQQPKPLVHRNTRRDSNNDSSVAEALQLITDALTRGGLPRLAGALILLLLASMLIRIPFGLVKAGIELIRAMIPERAKNSP